MTQAVRVFVDPGGWLAACTDVGRPVRLVRRRDAQQVVAASTHVAWATNRGVFRYTAPRRKKRTLFLAADLSVVSLHVTREGHVASIAHVGDGPDVVRFDGEIIAGNATGPRAAVTYAGGVIAWRERQMVHVHKIRARAPAQQLRRINGVRIDARNGQLLVRGANGAQTPLGEAFVRSESPYGSGGIVSVTARGGRIATLASAALATTSTTELEIRDTRTGDVVLVDTAGDADRSGAIGAIRLTASGRAVWLSTVYTPSFQPGVVIPPFTQVKTASKVLDSGTEIDPAFLLERRGAAVWLRDRRQRIETIP